MRRWRGLKLRRGAFFNAPPVSPVPPKWPPQVIRPAGALRTPARLLPSRRRRWDPGFGQGNQGQPWPSFIRQAGTRTRFTARMTRGRRFDPPWPQAAAPPPPQYLRPGGQLRFGARLLPSRRRSWGPAIPQGNLGQPWPSYIRQASSRQRAAARLTLSRGRRFDPPWPQAAAPVTGAGLLMATFP